MTESSINITDLFETILKKWKFLLLALVLGVAASSVYSFLLAKPVYRVTSSLYVGNPEIEEGEKDGFEYKREVESFMLLMPTYKEIAESNAVKLAVMEATGADWDDIELESKVTIYHMGGTQVLKFQVESSDVQEAISVANAFVEITKSVSQEIRGIDLVQPLDRAVKPDYPISPIHTNNIILGAVLGLLLALGFVVFKEVFQKLRKRKISL